VAQKFDAEVKALEKATQELELAGSKKDQKRKLRFRQGGEPHVARVADLAAARSLAPNGETPAVMLAALERAGQLQPFVDRVSAVAKRLTVARSGARSDAWRLFLRLYGMFDVIAQDDAALDAALQPVRDFLSPSARTAAKEGLRPAI
jgi:hypothetical protein